MHSDQQILCDRAPFQVGVVRVHDKDSMTSEEDDSDEVFIKGTIEGQPVTMFYDPGSRATILPYNFLKDPHNLKRKFSSASGHPIETTGPRMFTFSVKGYKIRLKAHITNSAMAILGQPFTRRCNKMVDEKGTRTLTYVDPKTNSQMVIYDRCTKSNPSSPDQILNIMQIRPYALEEDMFEEKFVDLEHDKELTLARSGQQNWRRSSQSGLSSVKGSATRERQWCTESTRSATPVR